jgi:hypothetical protein
MALRSLQNNTTLAARIALPPSSAPPPAPGWPPQSLVPPPALTDPRYTERGTQQVPPAAIQVASYTGSSAGGAPGAQFGPPGVGGAPVILGGFSLSPLALGAIVVVGAFVAWKVLR